MSNKEIERYSKKYGTKSGVLLNVKPDGKKVMVNQYGLEWVRVDAGGLYFKFRIVFKCNKAHGYKFVCGEPDEYNCTVYKTGEHHIDYNSKSPTLLFCGMTGNFDIFTAAVSSGTAQVRNEVQTIAKTVSAGTKAEPKTAPSVTQSRSDIKWFCQKWGCSDGMLLNIAPGQKSFVGNLGLDWIELQEGGIYFKFRVLYKNSIAQGYKFVDEEPDEYNCSSMALGEHYVDYNSKRPTLKFVGITSNMAILNDAVKTISVSSKELKKKAKTFDGVQPNKYSAMKIKPENKAVH